MVVYDACVVVCCVLVLLFRGCVWCCSFVVVFGFGFGVSFCDRCFVDSVVVVASLVVLLLMLLLLSFRCCGLRCWVVCFFVVVIVSGSLLLFR